MQFTAILIADQPLVEVGICPSVTTLMSIKNHAPTLATYTNLQQDMSSELHKPAPFLLDVVTLHPMKLKYFIKLEIRVRNNPSLACRIYLVY